MIRDSEEAGQERDRGRDVTKQRRMLGRVRDHFRRLPEWLRSPEALVVTLAALAQVAVLVSIRMSSNDVGGDLCRDTVAVQRLLHGENPYMPIPVCGVLRNL